ESFCNRHLGGQERIAPAAVGHHHFVCGLNRAVPPDTEKPANKGKQGSNLHSAFGYLLSRGLVIIVHGPAEYFEDQTPPRTHPTEKSPGLFQGKAVPPNTAPR